MLGMVSVAGDGSEAKLMEAPAVQSSTTQHFLGIGEDGKPVVFEMAGKRGIFVHKQ